MFLFNTLPLLLYLTASGPEINAAQFSQIVRERSDSMKTVVFVYEGRTRWIGPANLGMKSEMFDDDFQGTFLYRVDGAGLMDLFAKRNDPTSGVVRKKTAVLNGKSEEVRGLLDAKTPIDPARDIRSGSGSTSAFNDLWGIQDIFWSAWYWRERGDLNTRHYTFQGWEDLGGRDCLRFQIDISPNSSEHDQNFRRLWVDIERNAHVIKSETYQSGKLITRIENTLAEYPSQGGKSTWFPAKSVTRWYIWENKIYDDPVSERTIDIVHGSVRTNIDLPDAVFTVRRATALPTVGELAALEATSASGNLRKEFEAQPAKEPFRTDPASIRQRIDKNLAEADKQSKELEASSPARSTWTVTTGLQLACIVLGVGLLAGVFYWKWKGQ